MQYNKNDEEMYRYLICLSKTLRLLDMQSLADRVEHASRFVFGSPTEFYIESKEALELVSRCHGGRLPHDDIVAIESMLQKIVNAFKDIGGA